MTRKLKQRLGRAISIVMSAAMIVTALPADMLGGIASVSAAPDAGSATVLNVSDMTKGKVPAGAMNGSVFSAENDSMSVVEDTQTFDGEDFTKSLKLTADSVITFDAAKGDTLKVYAMTDNGQDGGSGANPDGKEDANGTQAAKSATKLTVTGEENGSGDNKARDTQSMDLTGTLAVKTLELAVDGSYTLTADGKAKVFYLELTEGTQQPDGNFIVKRYVLDASTTPNDVDENGAAVDNVEIPDGTKLGTDDYFEVVLGVTSDG
ncbi:MAG: hypothetical protein K2H41_12735, partial [Acetatifactor sp.]|nr:hypothetical protein [Acetatifactor sp.]